VLVCSIFNKNENKKKAVFMMTRNIFFAQRTLKKKDGDTDRDDLK